MTNSEKTSTTNNLSQHKYLKLKRQLQHEADSTLIATGDTEFQNHDQSLRSTITQDRRQKCTSSPASYSMQHQYKLVSDWDSQWHALYHHFTTYQQHRYPSNYQSSAMVATSHLKGSSDLPKLLTSTRLSPQVPAMAINRILLYAIHSILITAQAHQPVVPVARKTLYVMINQWTSYLITTTAATITAHHTTCQLHA